jgi:transposase
MRLLVSKSKNAASLYVQKSFRENGVATTKIIEKLGTEKELREKLDGRDPYEWANEYIAELNRKEKEQKRKVIVEFSQSKQIPTGEQVLFNGGYLFLQQIYHELKLDKICEQIENNYKITYSLHAVLSRLIYGRILYPSSKRATHGLSKNLLEPPLFQLQHTYRALEIIAKEHELIQASLYKNSLAVYPRNTKILFYDCTNFFFEIQQDEGLKQYGYSKDNKPNPLVQMGLFMDANGIPLAMSINPGNTNEQITLRPLEKQIIRDFELAEVVVCTDAGLASTANRKFNDVNNRKFITTQSVKNLKDFLDEWAFDSKGWKLEGSCETFHLDKIKKEMYEEESPYMKSTFYKERWINEDDLEQRLIVTFSPKYALYQEKIRNQQVERATKLMASGDSKIKKKNQNDVRRFIATDNCTADGEVAEKSVHYISQKVIEAEAKYDGFYGVCTNLEDSVEEIVKINKGRWEIEESFRIMKTDFESRPVYLSRDDRIKAHFITCYISLLVYRLLEKRLEDKFTTDEIISGLKNMNFLKLKGEGYAPAYTRNEFTDSLHDTFEFRTDFEIVSNKEMKKIFKHTKK